MKTFLGSDIDERQEQLLWDFLLGGYSTSAPQDGRTIIDKELHIARIGKRLDKPSKRLGEPNQLEKIFLERGIE